MSTPVRHDPCRPAASGILHCLYMLAEEAALLKMPQTLDAVLSAIEACEADASQAGHRR